MYRQPTQDQSAEDMSSASMANRVQPAAFERSQTYLAAARRLIPGATQTVRKAPEELLPGSTPAFCDRAYGCRIVDVDGNEFIDYIMALGPLILGYNHPAVRAAVVAQLSRGTVFSLSHRLEVELAERLTECLPGVEMVRFFKTGAESVAAAVRIARVITQRDHVAHCGYHGWHDWAIADRSYARGIPQGVKELLHSFRYNDLESLARLFRDYPDSIACVVLEAMTYVEPSGQFLEQVKRIAHVHGALLIFDEMWTGCRFALGGIQEVSGVTADLACYGKAMANGYPLAIVGGATAVMSSFEDIFVSTTFGGEALSLAAALAVLDTVRETPDLFSVLRDRGEMLKSGYNRLADDAGLQTYTYAQGPAQRHQIHFLDEHGAQSAVLRALFIQEVAARGILNNGGHTISLAHTEDDLKATLEIYAEVLRVLGAALQEGSVAQRLHSPLPERKFLIS